MDPPDPGDEVKARKRHFGTVIQVSMFRGRRHIAATIDPDAASDDEDPMDIVPMLSVTAQEESQPEVQDIALGPDPVMTWKAQECYPQLQLHACQTMEPSGIWS